MTKTLRCLLITTLLTFATLTASAQPALDPSPASPIVTTLTNLWSSLLGLLDEEPPTSTDDDVPAAPTPAPHDGPTGPDSDQEVGGYAEPGG